MDNTRLAISYPALLLSRLVPRPSFQSRLEHTFNWIVLLSLCLGFLRHPWPGMDNTWSAIFHIAKTTTGPPLPDNCSDDAKDFLSDCFRLDPKERPSASEVSDFTFLLSCSLFPDLKERPSALSPTLSSLDSDS